VSPWAVGYSFPRDLWKTFLLTTAVEISVSLDWKLLFDYHTATSLDFSGSCRDYLAVGYSVAKFFCLPIQFQNTNGKLNRGYRWEQQLNGAGWTSSEWQFLSKVLYTSSALGFLLFWQSLSRNNTAGDKLCL